MTNLFPPEAHAQLEEVSEWVEFDSQVMLAKAVGVLLGCHRHNFVVLPVGRWSMCVSKTGLECLTNHFTQWDLTSM